MKQKDLRFLQDVSIEELMEIKGIGKVKAIQILAGWLWTKTILGAFIFIGSASIICGSILANNRSCYYWRKWFFKCNANKKGTKRKGNEKQEKERKIIWNYLELE